MTSYRPKILLLLNSHELHDILRSGIENVYYGAEFTYAETMRELETRAIHGTLSGGYDAIIAMPSLAPDITIHELGEKLSWLKNSGHARNNPVCMVLDFHRQSELEEYPGVDVYAPLPLSATIIAELSEKLEARREILEQEQNR